jgi:hypothetical protein
MRKRLQVLFLILGFVTGNAQSGSINNESIIPNITPPTHQTFSLSRVNYNAGSDGKFHHTIPLFSIDDDLGMNISLGYRSDVKVDDIGGSLGMSWQLNFGGVVSRVVKDEADEGNYTKWRPTEVNEVTDLYNIRQAAAPGNVYDTEYDWFNFSIPNGLSGSFYIDENLNVFSEDSENVKIQIYQIGTSISEYGKKLEIKLTDSQGNEYYFGGDDQYIERTKFVAQGPDRKSITGWYLRKIINAKKEEINFQYDIEQINYLSSASASFSIRQICFSPTEYHNVFNDVVKSKSQTTAFTPRIKSIETSIKKIFFNYGKFRNDLPGGTGKLLTGVSLKDKNLNVIKEYEIEYYDVQKSPPATYYNISSTETATTNRHFIKSLTNLNNARDKYGFEYYDIDKIPARFSLNTDYYNYYNSANNSSPFPGNSETLNFFTNLIPPTLISANKEVKPENAPIGNLKKISYPTGGFSEVFYEPNYSMKTIKEYIPTLSPTLELDKKPCENINITEKYFYFTSNGTSVRFTSGGGYYQCNSEIDSLHDQYKIEIHRKQGQTWIHEKTIITDVLQSLDYSFPTKPNEEYQIRFTLDARFTAINVQLDIQYNLEEKIKVVPSYVGGSRVSRIEENDTLSQKYTKKYYYNPLTKLNDPISSMVNFAADKTHIEKGEYSANCQANSPTPRFTIMNIFRVYENPLYNDFNSRNSGMFYSDVTEIIDGHSAKETTFSYVDDNDPNFLKPPFYTGVAMSNYGQIYRGNVLNENKYEFKDGAFKRIEEKSFKYDFVKHSTKRSFFFRENFSYVPLPSEDQLINISYGFYDNYYGFRKQTKIETINYVNDIPLTTITEYNYTSPSHYQLTDQKTTFPDGSYQTTDYSYAYEKGKTKLIDANMVGIPLVTETKKNGRTLSQTETVYPDVLPDSQTGNLLLPKSISSLDLVTGNMSTDVIYNEYDSKGNLLQYTTKAGVPTAIVWGYNQTQPIAKVEGATYAQVSGLATAIVTASNTDASAGANNDETNFLTTLDSFRNSSALSGHQITTYSYDPLIGVRSITPPNGIRETYIYDTANRLKEVRDVNGNLLKSNEYHYRP